MARPKDARGVEIPVNVPADDHVQGLMHDALAEAFKYDCTICARPAYHPNSLRWQPHEQWCEKGKQDGDVNN